MKTLIILILLVLKPIIGLSQCDIKVTKRPDGNTIKYFKPKPVARHSNYEAGLGLYYNESTEQYTLSLFFLIKKGDKQKVTTDLIIQTTGSDGLRLKPYTSELIEMNGNFVATTIYILKERDITVLKKYNLKTLAFWFDSMIGLTVTENKDVLIKEFNCLN